MQRTALGRDFVKRGIQGYVNQRNTTNQRRSMSDRQIRIISVGFAHYLISIMNRVRRVPDSVVRDLEALSNDLFEDFGDKIFGFPPKIYQMTINEAEQLPFDFWFFAI